MYQNNQIQNKPSTANWNAIETKDAQLLEQLLHESQKHSKVYAVTGDAGTGKSFAIANYVSQQEAAYHLVCAEYWTEKYFLQRLLQLIGVKAVAGTTAYLMDTLVQQLRKKEQPIVIIDEADKLNDKVLRFFITIYNELEGRCGFILCATDHLNKRIRQGLALNRKGYQEIFSRINRDFIELQGVDSMDVAQLCMANGIQDKRTIKSIITACQRDLRIIKEEILAIKQLKKLEENRKETSKEK